MIIGLPKQNEELDSEELGAPDPAPTVEVEAEVPKQRRRRKMQTKQVKITKAKHNGRGGDGANREALTGPTPAKKGIRPSLPEETLPAPVLPKAKRTAADYDLSDILADDSDEDYADPVPMGERITFKLPKTSFIRMRPGREHQIIVNVIKLGEEDQRAGQLSAFVLSKQMVKYVREELNYPISKYTVRDACTMQGEGFLYLHTYGTEALSDNSYNKSKREILQIAEKSWVRVMTSQEKRRYEAVKRKDSLKPIEPTWSAEPLAERFQRSLGEMFIGEEDHPVMKRLRGEESEDTGEKE
jgi:hypothetical protein